MMWPPTSIGHRVPAFVALLGCAVAFAGMLTPWLAEDWRSEIGHGVRESVLAF